MSPTALSWNVSVDDPASVLMLGKSLPETGERAGGRYRPLAFPEGSNFESDLASPPRAKRDVHPSAITAKQISGSSLLLVGDLIMLDRVLTFLSVCVGRWAPSGSTQIECKDANERETE
jgi:hypothetical protein